MPRQWGEEPVQSKKTVMNHYPDYLRDCQKPVTLSTWTDGRMPPTAQRGATEHKECGSHPMEDTLLPECLAGVRVNVTGGTSFVLATPPWRSH